MFSFFFFFSNRERLYLEAPLITEDAVEALKMVSSDESRGLAPLQLLKEMVVRRPTKQLVFLNVLLCHTGHENNTVRFNDRMFLQNIRDAAQDSKKVLL